MNIPNLLTTLRVLSIPLLVIFLMNEQRHFAWWLFGFAAFTDGLDGFIARVFHQKTLLGAYIDPIADKLLIGATYITMAILGWLPGWLCVLVISRDLIIFIGIGILYAVGKKFTVAPVLDSKLTTLMQLLTIFYYLYDKSPLFLVESEPYILFFTAAMTLFSGLHYLYLGFAILGGNHLNGSGT
ncbi:MAG: CDP-alcohol phosphatidyltransferase family protein [Thermodesulfobacteriota bacterium]